MTADALKDCNKKHLARMAKEQGITGWHAMRKDQLIRALAPVPRPTRKTGAANAKPAAVNGKPAAVNGKPVANGKAAVTNGVASSNGHAHASNVKAVVGPNGHAPRRSTPPPPPRPMPLPSVPRTLGHDCVKDRIVTMVRDPYWLHAHWELSRATLGRAQAALGQDWHTARPILRVMDVTSDETTRAGERHVRDIPIHGGVTNWYIDVTAPPRSFRVDIGYLSARGKFFVLARSNVVGTPRAGGAEMIDQNWDSVGDNAQKIYHQSGGPGPQGPSDQLREVLEERLGRPMHSLSLQSLMTGALPLPGRGFHFEIDAELIVYGATEPNARVTLQGEPVQLRPDGTFTVRFSLPDARQIIPATAASPDGVEERTIVLAVERNTKELEPMIHDGNEL